MKKVHMAMLSTMLMVSSFVVAQQTKDAAGGVPSSKVQAKATDAPPSPNQANAPSPASTVTGSGTANTLAMWTSSSVIGNSHISQSGGNTGIGTSSPQYALDVAGHINSSSGFALGEEVILTQPGGSGDGNIALGYQALLNNTSGYYNVADGFDALEANTAGYINTATGGSTLMANVGGSGNTGDGYSALYSNQSGLDNTAVGLLSLYNNVAGNSNIGLGYAAGYYVGNSNNIDIGNWGASTDSGAIRIGTSGTQTSFFAAGVYGVSSGSSSAVPVLVDSSGQLVTVSSSRRYKEDIQDMGNASSGLMRLRPVTFRYKKSLADGSKPIQYGLIAEEVAEVYPDLVSYSDDGQIETVKYQLLDPMLLNEVQRQQTQIQELQERLSKMEAALASITGVREAQ